MKRVCKILLLALVCSSFVACSKGSATYENQVVTQKENIYATRYDSFSGRDIVEVVLPHKSHVVIEVETLEGTLDIAFVEKEDEKGETPFIEEKNVETSQREGTVEAGEYLLIVSGKDHKGGYGISYE